MYFKIKSAANFGINGYLVDVEIHIANGLPRFKIVGLPDKAVEEAKERVIAAIKSSGYTFPLKRITVNLAPSNIPKHGPAFDLPIALGILGASRQITPLYKPLRTTIFCGELGLDGKLKKTPGVPIIVQTAIDKQIASIVIPRQNSIPNDLTSEIKVSAVNSLTETIAFLLGKKIPVLAKYTETTQNDTPVVTEIYGNEDALRTATIATAGRHHIMLEGPPGCGKTMLAQGMAQLSPLRSTREIFEISKIYSISNEPMPSGRPFRNPHHTTSLVSLIGGGSIPVPGEISLAHNGILFMDEFGEFSSQAINALRQPMETGIINISRKFGKVIFPCNFLLVAAMNPCPCGFMGHPNKQCTCSASRIKKYTEKIPNAIWDRIDMQISIMPENIENLRTKKLTTQQFRAIKQKVENAQMLQQERSSFNNRISLEQSRKLCPLTQTAQKLIDEAYKKLGFSTRGYLHTIRVARTIADLENSTKIREEHIAEAISYRRKI